MSATLAELRMNALSEREGHALDAALIAASVALDALAAGALLTGTPLAPWLEALAAAVLHATAVLLLSGVARARPSRRWLGAAAALAVPGLGASVAFATLVARGYGSAAMGRRRKARRRRGLTSAAIRRLGSALSPCDALECGDEEERRAALRALSHRRDAEAIALLRHTAAGRDPDLALSAALVLDEIGERFERRVVRSVPAEARRVAG